MEIKAIAFDLDNSLIDFSTFKQKTAWAAARAMVAKGLKEKPLVLYKKIFAIYETKGIEYQKTFADVLGGYNLSLNEFERIQQAAITAYLQTKFKVLKPYPSIRPTILKLRKKGLILGIVTDAPRNKAWQRLVLTGLDDLFDIVITYDDTKKHKPDPAPFKLFLKKARVKANETLFVGDNPEKDVKGAKAVGMRTALAEYGWHLNKESKEKPVFFIKKLGELTSLVG